MEMISTNQSAKKTTENKPVLIADEMTDKTTNAIADHTADEPIEEESLFSGLPAEVMQSMTPARNRMVMLYLTGMYTKGEIAKIIGVSHNTITAWLMNPSVQAVIAELQKREFAVIESKLKSMRNKAVDTMGELMDSPMENVRFSAAKDVLDRSGHKAQQNIKVDKTVTTIEQQLQQLADFTIDESEIIDITDVVELVKSE